ncbi:DUF1501 domain-containing protein [Candidatus Endoriftia persephonae]|uniref:DUF1501 domain-containing protein n=2 Tax=Gammaproteobacteria TaxID=1236 RepID=G2FJW4_9GAMM|nr:DUF1501 domain-containing protein [Candidatus Endoriftia persephone]EGW52910.1 hypothetical protein TevJSym_cd00010 [endosymbiont of Tevnia jerichonana (vent Tica)]USF88574.1 DUF1501 domain-containing protein [Candidatus Endoriftia persephone]
MKRREFLRLAGVAGMAAVLPGWTRPGMAAAYNGPILITLHAGGGWDQSSFCDPREDSAVNRWAASAPAGRAGNLRYAPFAENAEFFQRHHQRMLVINGIDLQSNGHGAAERNRSTGQLMTGYPSLNELLAGVHGQGMPMPFVRASGFSETAGVMPFTGLPDESLLRTMADPNWRDANRTFHKPSDIAIVRRFQLERLQAQRQRPDNLPRWQGKLDELYSARSGSGGLARLADVMPASLDTTDLKGDRSSLVRDMHLFLVMAAAGMSVTGVFSSGGFDTHGNHDNNQAAALLRLTRGLDYLWSKAEQIGLANRLLVHVTSDVGRTPSYNSNNGKDHWSAGSELLMRQGVGWTDRIVGAGGPRHEKLAIDPRTLQIDSAGMLLQPRHIQSELRKLLGIDQHPLARRFPLRAEPVGLFDPNRSTGIQV